MFLILLLRQMHLPIVKRIVWHPTRRKIRLTKEENTLTNGIPYKVNIIPNNTVAYWFHVQLLSFQTDRIFVLVVVVVVPAFKYGSRMILLQETKVQSGQCQIKCNKICRSSRTSRILQTDQILNDLSCTDHIRKKDHFDGVRVLDKIFQEK